MEGTGSYGVRLARHLSAMGIMVREAERTKRRHLRRDGKSDPKDGEAATRAVPASEAAGLPKSGDCRVEMVRALRSARRSAVKARLQATNLLQSMLVTAPEELRRRLRGLLTKEELVAICEGLEGFRYLPREGIPAGRIDASKSTGSRSHIKKVKEKSLKASCGILTDYKRFNQICLIHWEFIGVWSHYGTRKRSVDKGRT